MMKTFQHHKIQYLMAFVAIILLIPGIFACENVFPFVDPSYEFSKYKCGGFVLIQIRLAIYAYLIAVLFIPYKRVRFLMGALPFMGYALLMFYLLLTTPNVGLAGAAVFGFSIALTIFGFCILALIFAATHPRRLVGIPILLLLIALGAAVQLPSIAKTMGELERYNLNKYYQDTLEKIESNEKYSIGEMVEECKRVDMESFNLNFGDGVAHCVFKLAEKKKEPSICDQLDLEERRITCLSKYYVDSSFETRSNICLQAEVNSVKDLCLMMVTIPSSGVPDAEHQKICDLMSGTTSNKIQGTYKESCLRSLLSKKERNKEGI